MKISVIIPATNPLTNNYQVFFPCVESWSHVVDEIIIVDGGMADSSYSVLQNYVKHFKVISNKKTYWPFNKPFHGLQFAVNINEAIENSTSDWIILAHADYILNYYNKDLLYNFLYSHTKYPMVSYMRYKVDISNNKKHEDWRGIIVNKRLINDRYGEPQYRFGAYSLSGTVSDFPLTAIKKSYFIHPYSNAIVKIYSGHLIPGDIHIPINILNCCVLDHFFYPPFQVRKQGIMFFEFYSARQLGTAPISEEEINIIKKLNNISKYYSLQEIKDCKLFPKIFREMVEIWWHDECYGAAFHKESLINLETYKLQMHRIIRKLQSKLIKITGCKGIYYSHKWETIESKEQCALNIQQIWNEQNEKISKLKIINYSKI